MIPSLSLPLLIVLGNDLYEISCQVMAILLGLCFPSLEANCEPLRIAGQAIPTTHGLILITCAILRYHKDICDFSIHAYGRLGEPAGLRLRILIRGDYFTKWLPTIAILLVFASLVRCQWWLLRTLLKHFLVTWRIAMSGQVAWEEWSEIGKSLLFESVFVTISVAGFPVAMVLSVAVVWLLGILIIECARFGISAILYGRSGWLTGAVCVACTVAALWWNSRDFVFEQYQ